MRKDISEYRSCIPRGCQVMVDSCYPDEGFLGKIEASRRSGGQWSYLIGGYWYKEGEVTIHIEFRNCIIINDIEDFNSIVEELLSAFVDSLMKDERYLTSEVHKEYGPRCLNQRGAVLLERYMSRLAKLAAKIFSPEDLDYLDLGYE